MYKKILKPWFIRNPFLIVRALLLNHGLVRSGWLRLKTCYGELIFCDTNKAIGRAIYKNGVYELATSELLWRMLAKFNDGLFIDVGSNVGYYSLLARARLGPAGMVFSFEPMPYLYEKLLLNLQGLNVSAYQYAVSSSDGHAVLRLPKGYESNDGIATLQPCVDTVDSFIVKTVSLDRFIDKEITILKIDVEGHEYNVISGARSLISARKIQNIIFEDHDIHNSAVVAQLLASGYQIFSIGWNFSGLVIKPLGEANKSFTSEAPNFIATLNVSMLKLVTSAPGWTILNEV